MENRAQTITFGAICAFLMCYFVKLFNFPNEFIVILGGGLCLACIIWQKKLRIDAGLCLMAITLVSYYLIPNGMRGLFYAILYIPLVIYFVVIYVVIGNQDSKKYEQRLFLLIMMLVIGFTIHGILNSYMYYAGYVVPGTRRWQDFWSNEIVPGTQHSAYFLPALTMFFPAIIYFKKRKILNTVFIAATIFFCYTALVTKSRMQIVVFVLVFFVELVLWVSFEKEKLKKLLSNKIIYILIAGIIVLLLIGFVMVKDTKVIDSFINNMGKGGGILNNVRFEAQKMALTQLFDFPMGGRKMNLGRDYCHNTWLDMANLSGLIPFFAFSAYTVYTAILMIKFLIKGNVSAEIKLIVCGLYVSFLLYMTVESVFDASIHLLTPWIFINAIAYSEQGELK